MTSGKGDEAFSVKTYSTKTETDLQTVISKIEGAGKTEVLLTMENSVEYVYLDNSTTKTKEIEPLIRGVLVVCEAVMILLWLSVSPMQSQKRLIFQQQKYVLQNYQNKGRE